MVVRVRNRVSTAAKVRDMVKRRVGGRMGCFGG
jgi:hypothetical protein